MARVRLSGGRFRGQYFEVPPGVRPTAGRVREALISIWRQELPGARFLELFAGSGAVAAEALGSGVRAVVLVESDPRVARTLRRNLERVAPGEPWRVIRLELPRGMAALAERPEAPFDLVFADPPYRFEAYAELLSGIEGLLAPGGQVGLEHSTRARWSAPEGGRLHLLQRRVYGETGLSFYGPDLAVNDSAP